MSTHRIHSHAHEHTNIRKQLVPEEEAQIPMILDDQTKTSDIGQVDLLARFANAWFIQSNRLTAIIALDSEKQQKQ